LGKQLYPVAFLFILSTVLSLLKIWCH